MVQINLEKCVGCGSCVSDCTMSRIRLENGKAHVLGHCFECGHCVCVCPTGAVTMEGYDQSEVLPIPKEGGALDPDKLMMAIRSRRSVRRYQKKPVEREKIERILEAARFSPTGSNAQNVEFIVLQDRLEEFTRHALKALHSLGGEMLAHQEELNHSQARYAQRFYEMEGQYQQQGLDRLFFGAPAVLVFTGTNEIDPAITASKAELMANALGLGCVYIGFFRAAAEHDPSLRQALGLEEGRHVVCTLALGYPAVRYFRTTPRKPRKTQFM